MPGHQHYPVTALQGLFQVLLYPLARLRFPDIRVMHPGFRSPFLQLHQQVERAALVGQIEDGVAHEHFVIEIDHVEPDDEIGAILDQLWAIFAVSFVIECLSLVWSPARDASLPNLVPRRQLANANSIGLVSTYGTLPLGALIFTVLVGLSEWMGGRVPIVGARPEALALLLDAGTFAFSERGYDHCTIAPALDGAPPESRS